MKRCALRWLQTEKKNYSMINFVAVLGRYQHLFFDIPDEYFVHRHGIVQNPHDMISFYLNKEFPSITCTSSVRD